MKDKQFYLSHVEELCKDMERNIQLAWDVFVEKIYNDSKFVKKKNLSKFPENEEIHRDLVSQAIEKVIEEKAKLLGKRNSCTSLITSTIKIVALRAIDYFRKHTKSIMPPESTMPHPYGELGELVEKILLTKTTPFLTEIFNLKISGFENTEIAEKLGISESSVSSALHKARRILSEYLKDYRK